jgi:hypothetical protein
MIGEMDVAGSAEGGDLFFGAHGLPPGHVGHSNGLSERQRRFDSIGHPRGMTRNGGAQGDGLFELCR